MQHRTEGAIRDSALARCPGFLGDDPLAVRGRPDPVTGGAVRVGLHDSLITDDTGSVP